MYLSVTDQGWSLLLIWVLYKTIEGAEMTQTVWDPLFWGMLEAGVGSLVLEAFFEPSSQPGEQAAQGDAVFQG